MTMVNNNDALINYDHGTRIARLETTIENINQTLIEIKSDMKSGFDKLNSRMWMNFYWSVGAAAAILLVMAHGFHWF